MSEGTFHPLDYLSLIRRRLWWMVIPLAVSILGGIMLVLVLPHVYRSHATVAMAMPRVSTDLVGQGSVVSREDRLRAISQQLLSRPVLEQVAHAEGLDINRPMNDVVDEMLAPDRIKVEPTELLKQVPSEKAPLDAFVLSYGGPTGELAQRVTNRLANVFVETTSRSREARAENTSEFISTQLTESKKRLDALEVRLRHAKEAYMGRLPEQMQANLSMVAGLRQQLESTAISLRGEQDRLSMLERQIEGMRQGANDLGLPRAAQVSNAQVRVLQLEQDLANARATYTEKHPEIQRLIEELASARKDAIAERSRPAADRLAGLQLDPTYVQLLRDRDAARVRVSQLQRGQQQMSSQVQMYQTRVESAPMVEQQLVSLQREYDLEKQQYTALSGKLQASQVNESLERDRGGEQFKVLYSAYRPRTPESPNIVRIILMSVLLGLVLGAGAAMGREYFDRSVHDVRGLQSEYDVPVLGEIARIPRRAQGAVR
jgi:polysaccharide chain length determinant protein (PEP-CTERM system associated)